MHSHSLLNKNTKIESNGTNTAIEENASLIRRNTVVERREASAADYVSLLPVMAAIFFTGAISAQPNTPENIALIVSILPATILPAFSSLLNVHGRLTKNGRQVVDTIASILMGNAVALMMKGAADGLKEVKGSELVSAKVGLTAIILFSLFVALNVSHNILKLFRFIQDDKPLVLFLASVSGLIGSTLFGAKQGLDFLAAHKADDQVAMKAAALIFMAAVCFVVTTGFHTFNSAKAINATKAINTDKAVRVGLFQPVSEVDAKNAETFGIITHDNRVPA